MSQPTAAALAARIIALHSEQGTPIEAFTGSREADMSDLCEALSATLPEVMAAQALMLAHGTASVDTWGGEEWYVTAHHIAPGMRWNGFAVPYFDRAEGERIATRTTALRAEYEDAELVTYAPDRDAFAISDVYGTDYTEGMPCPLGCGETVYPIGAFGWTWSEITDYGM